MSHKWCQSHQKFPSMLSLLKVDCFLVVSIVS
nr:MAG TPA: hypothetical protein [Caudoviricetes sp.]